MQRGRRNRARSLARLRPRRTVTRRQPVAMGSSVRTAILRASADGYAGLAASRLAEQAPGALGSDGFEAWRRHYRAQLQALIAALEDELPERYAAHVAWLRDAQQARGGDPAVFSAALDALEFVLEQHLPAAADPVLSRCFELARAALTAPRAAAPPAPAASPLARAYVEALLDCDKERALREVDAALAESRVDPAALLDEVLPYAQREIGELWHRGSIGVAEEHFATQVTRQCIGRLLARAQPAAPGAARVVVTSLQGDGHDIGVQLVACAFELAGWRTVFLGANTPIEEVVAIARKLDAQVVALGGTLDEHRAPIAAAVRALRAGAPRARVIVGGAAFDGSEDLWRRSGADALARAPSEAPRCAASLLGTLA
ncbi:MAG: hypothetical protein EPO68_02640 [Planctomycetota bacterium]|nr:MAG: hypothetical protein EPO68_02640 [Planctomycetota bacterium]